ncbi:MAG TPA: DUF1553 domain-containing protein [Planctomycetes bacterium]|nr:DUF1553 domain-containing protein [Planctomycetaceae bacterium]HIM28101.1 DUF1553 domain-containing protein [Planctomycetota bacterium]
MKPATRSTRRLGPEIVFGWFSMARCTVVALMGGLLMGGLPCSGEETIDFSQDIRPILANHCFQCHGPDEGQRVSDFRLDQRSSLFGDLGDGRRAVVPGDVSLSELVERVRSSDPERQMPPPDADRPIVPDQIELLTKWVQLGADWREHWAFVAPIRSDSSLADDPWQRNTIDRFIQSSILKAGRSPSPEASKRKQIRRLTLDLTGLPPTPDSIRDFLQDHSPDAYERLLDRLLQSPQYGERMALIWLDAARYADTSGYQNDGPRDMWRWRDWVIAALNDNKPFDEFTIEQLAGDLIPNSTMAQRIATGFNRNHRGNAEGGIIPEEYQVEYVVDRVETTATVWLGLTVGCARCHDHKYDPIRQRDFYGLFAFFNSLPENGRAIKEGNSPPYTPAPTTSQTQQLQHLMDQVRQLDHRWKSSKTSIDEDFQSWQTRPLSGANEWNVSDQLDIHLTMDKAVATADDEAANAPDKETAPELTTGKIGTAFQFRGADQEFGDLADFGYFDAFSVSAWIRPERKTGTIISRMTPVDQGSGYYLHLEDGHVQVNLVKRWLDDSIRVEASGTIPLGSWSHVLMTYDGSRVAKGIRIYIDGKLQDNDIKLDSINQTFSSTEPFRVGGGHSMFFGAIDDVRIYFRAVSENEASWIAEPFNVQEILQLAAQDRTVPQTGKMFEYYRLFGSKPPLRKLYEDLKRKTAESELYRSNLPTVMVMRDQPGIRQTFILGRGQYNQPGEAVDASTPAVLPPFPEAFPKNRLGLAKWLVDRDNPLTARVFVNKIWQMHFGEGLVRSPEDFGVQGARPTHPELLDWLAVEFMESGWDIKHLHKLMLMSATYRQDSTWSGAAADDPQNHLWARGPRVRLQAELIRDQALALGGLLTTSLGGESVRPYQPAGLWQEIATVTDYQQSTGSDLYRRSLYTYWKRTVPPPTMATFDAISRESCVVRRSRTNTPLQALALMNDVTFVEAARGLAQRTLSQADVGATHRKHLVSIFQRATARPPGVGEMRVLERVHGRSLREFRENPDLAKKWLEHGELKVPPGDAIELAALATVASLVLNLDEVITRE